MSSSSLLRLGGLTAAVGGVMLIVAGLAQLVENLFFPYPGVVSGGMMAVLYVQSALGLLGHVLLMLGLVALYVRQSEATSMFGLLSFLIAFLGMALPTGFEWGDVLTNLGWALFGVASLQALVYPRGAAILLIVGAVITGVFNHLLVALVAGGPGSILVYVGVGAEIIRDMAIGWLGYALFSGRTIAADRPQLVR